MMKVFPERAYRPNGQAVKVTCKLETKIQDPYRKKVASNLD
jgi:hypothetical protein